MEDWRSAPIDDRLKATLGFLEKVTLSPEAINANDIAPLKAANVEAKAIEEALYACLLFNIMDRLADAFDFKRMNAEDLQQGAHLLFKRGYGALSLPG